MKLYAHTNGSKHEVDLRDELGHLVLNVGKDSYVLNLDEQPGVIRTVFFSGGKGRPARKIEFAWTRNDNRYSILIDGVVYEVEVRDARSERAASLFGVKPEAQGAVEVRAPIPGQITRILVKPGAAVKKGESVLTLDAMKLENEIQAPKDGKVASIVVKPGATVDKGQLLFIIE